MDILNRDGSFPEGSEDLIVAGDADCNQFLGEAMALMGACGIQPIAAQRQAGGPGCSIGARMTVLGAPLTTLAASADTTVTITVRLRGGNAFVGRRLILPAEFAASVRVASVKVDATDITPSTDPIPGEAFSSANQRGGALPFVPAGQNSVITVTLTNETSAAIAATLAIEGAVL